MRDCAFIMLDADGRIATWNAGAEAISGYEASEVLGKALTVFYAEEDAAIPAQVLECTREKGRHEFEGWRVRKGGRRFWAHEVVAAIHDENGNLVGYSKLTRDLTERQLAQRAIEQSFDELRTLQQELTERNRELEIETVRANAANRMKSDFLANMSHELRTPLNGILGFSELLIDDKAGALNGEQKEYVGDIHTCGRHLLGLINNLLDLAKIEAGRMDMEPEPMSLNEATDQVSRTLQSIARQKVIEFDTVVIAAEDVVTLDPRIYRQIVFNLGANAIKFTNPHGRVRLEVTDKGAVDCIEVRVRDTGIGMTSEEISRLFVPFQQLDSGPGRRHQGSGLGLVLTRRFAELCGGSIRVESAKGQGTTFTVTLPRGPKPEA
jgi:protein-histidine pros-kinase